MKAQLLAESDFLVYIMVLKINLLICKSWHSVFSLSEEKLVIEIGILQEAIAQLCDHIKKKLMTRGLGSVTYSSNLVWVVFNITMLSSLLYEFHVCTKSDSAETGV